MLIQNLYEKQAGQIQIKNFYDERCENFLYDFYYSSYGSKVYPTNVESIPTYFVRKLIELASISGI